MAATERQRIDEWETQELKPVADNLAFFETWSAFITQSSSIRIQSKTLSTPYGKSKAAQLKSSLSQPIRISFSSM
ncbi:hypothetical protein PO124_33335 [Bacillus licheniformis]|nr:hypothetical protein [Bacillus licheniformis]